MELKLEKANIFTIPAVARTVLNIHKQPFFFTRCNGVVYMNEDMDKLDETAAAIASWWENTQADPTEENVAAYDAAWNAMKELHEEGHGIYKNFWGDSSDAAATYGFLLGMEYGKKLGGNGHE